MKLVIAIVHLKDADRCVAALNEAGFICTRFTSFGGFLDRDNATLLIGVDAVQVDEVMGIVRRCAKSRSEILAVAPLQLPAGRLTPDVEVEHGGATVFVVDVDRFERL